MAAPVSGTSPAKRERNGHKHKRLFMGGPGALTVGHLLLVKHATYRKSPMLAPLPDCSSTGKFKGLVVLPKHKHLIVKRA